MFGQKDEMPDEFWRHSMAVAAGASIAARFADVSPGDAVVRGPAPPPRVALLYRLDRDDYNARIAEGLDPVEYLAAEHEAYGGDHAMIGAFALDAWKLFRVDLRRDPQPPPRPDHRRRQTDAVVIAGEALASAADGNPETGVRPDGHEPVVDPADAFKAMGDSAAISVDNLVQRTAEEAEALDAVLSSVR